MDNQIIANAASSVAHAASSSPVLSPAVLETIKTWVLYVGVLASAVIAAFAGIRKALKDLKGDGKPGLVNPGGAAIHSGVTGFVGGTIMETTTLLMWSESNKEVAAAAEAVKDCIKANTQAIECLPDEMDEKLGSIVNAINYNTDAVRDMCREFSETRHEIVRLRDSMERRR